MDRYCQHEDCAKEANHIYEKKDACYHKVKARYDVWPSAYASGALVKCRKVGAKNWGNKSKKEGLADKFKKNIDKYNKKAKKSRDYLKKLKKKEGFAEGVVKLNKSDMDKLHKNKSVEKGDDKIIYDESQAYDIWC